MKSLSHSRYGAGLVLGAFLLAGCSAGPDYVRPTVATAPAQYKAAQGWVMAQPSDALERGDWWTLFNDPVLNDLAQRVNISNQTLAAAEAAYRQARALTRENRSSLFPSVDLSGSGNKSHGGGNITDRSSYQVAIGASWEVDLWGRIRRSVESAAASAQASAADLAAARLSAQGELAANYLNLREKDTEIAIVRQTVEAYDRTLTIAQNRYKAGIAARTDVFQAQSQLASARSELAGLTRDRATYENAIAVLVGEPASSFSIAPAQWTSIVPQIPISVPSTILQRRPDIASAERTVAAANAQIGVEQAAFFPSLSLSGSVGQSASALGDLFSSSATLWSLGASVLETIFDAGARSARVAQARASFDQAVANYRQTVLSAFEDVENQLTATRVLEEQQALLQQASAAADQAEQSILNQYRAGQVNYTEVVTAQVTALNARRQLLQTEVARQTTAVALVQSLGGGWSATPENLAPDTITK